MRALVVLLAAALALAPVADAGKRARKHGTVRAGHGKAPKKWRYVTNWSALTQAPAPSTPGATPAPAPTPTPGSALPGADPRSVSVNSTEFALTLSQTTVSAGTVRVQFDNSRAEDPHQLAIDGPDPDYWSLPEVPAGAVTQHALVMRAGRHVLFCPLPEHEQRGMRAILTVR